MELTKMIKCETKCNMSFMSVHQYMAMTVALPYEVRFEKRIEGLLKYIFL
jgi:hypothetical protein